MTPRLRPHLLACLALVPLVLGGSRRAAHPAPAQDATAATAGADTARRRPVPRPRAPLVLTDVCPSECCQLGTWTANTRLKVRAAATDSAAVAFHLAPGSSFEAVAGNLHVEQLGVVVVRRRHAMTDEEGTKRVFQPGDTILVVSDLGEGIVLAWFRGEEMVLDGLWWPLDPDEPAAAGRTHADLRRPLLARWWVRVSQEGREGWLEMSQSVDVTGRDACN
jgi:hypothetical protein